MKQELQKKGHVERMFTHLSIPQGRFAASHFVLTLGFEDPSGCFVLLALSLLKVLLNETCLKLALDGRTFCMVFALKKNVQSIAFTLCTVHCLCFMIDETNFPNSEL